jgi:hypothetical protein
VILKLLRPGAASKIICSETQNRKRFLMPGLKFELKTDHTYSANLYIFMDFIFYTISTAMPQKLYNRKIRLEYIMVLEFAMNI